jgi:hypothetical protein
MSTEAACLSGVPCDERLAAKQVLAVRDEFKVRRIDAIAHPA